eukprot:gnl/Hemi2/11916_TR4066_c0_g1_i1.p1 gnl/Hemi2/11916_TR4066_c0_g1~~gnl/Hemi2/11916_TR4066_c0_g1_i1.p1  ORF type:complete len:216 (-),score=48.49 gnl/Hemi2/11916_TR4066_c0_g1_i1:100-666(-)
MKVLVVATLFFCATVAALVQTWQWGSTDRLPARLATHFNLSGEGSLLAPQSVVVWTAAGIHAALAVLIGSVAHKVLTSTTTNAEGLKVPHKAYWTASPARLVVARSVAATSALAVGLATQLLLIFVASVVFKANEAVLIQQQAGHADAVARVDIFSILSFVGVDFVAILAASWAYPRFALAVPATHSD